MLKAIIFKEWIKLKWFLIFYAIFGIMTVGYIFILVRHDIAFHDAKSYWYAILFQGFQYFKYLRYVPLLGGLLIGVAQFFPETVNKRIKLTFHLPREENTLLLMMTGFGAVSLLICYLLMFLFFTGLSMLFFPSQIIMAALVSICPWFLAGMAAYFLSSLVILEPVWIFRLLYFIAACTIIPFFIQPAVSGGYHPINSILFVMVLLLSISILFSGYRFRKGEM
jgi:hypothetical protein